MEPDERVRMPPPLTVGPYKKENCWICWIENEKGQVYDIEIYETFPSNPGKVNKYLELRLGRKSFCDIGNCLANWSEWTLEDILHQCGFLLEWETHEVKINFLIKLANIEEFSRKVNGYLRYHKPLYM